MNTLLHVLVTISVRLANDDKAVIVEFLEGDAHELMGCRVFTGRREGAVGQHLSGGGGGGRGACLHCQYLL